MEFSTKAVRCYLLNILRCRQDGVSLCSAASQNRMGHVIPTVRLNDAELDVVSSRSLQGSTCSCEYTFDEVGDISL